MLAGLAHLIEYWTCDLGECIEPGLSPNLRKKNRLLGLFTVCRIARKTVGAVLERHVKESTFITLGMKTLMMAAPLGQSLK